MTIERREPFGAIEPAALARLEETLPAPLPEDFRRSGGAADDPFLGGSREAHS